VQTQWDAYRFAMLGVPRDHIRVTGNWKRLFPNRPQNPLSLEALGLSERDRVMILASVRSGEYDLALRLIRQLHAHVPDVRFLLAPRHMDHLGSLFSRLDRMHIDYQRWSADPARWDTTVLVLDTLGELLRFFPIGYLAVVFGSFAPYGGHNLLEPVFAGVPVVFGPYVQNVRDLASRILARGAGLQVASDVELIRTLRDLLENPQRYQMLREAARGFPEAGEDRVNTLMHELKEIIRAVPTGYAH
jgi:3-deoxy-D-manno-octulosonic-acid transferase